MKKLNEIELFVNMLEGSDEHFRVIPLGKETHVAFTLRKILFIFDDKGKFLKIANLK